MIAEIAKYIIIKNMSVGTSSDFDGNFLLKIPEGAKTLVFSYTGYTTQELALTSATTYNVSMLVDGNLLEEVVVIGYGTARTKDLTGSAVIVKSEDFNKGSVTTPEQLVMGKIPGVKINSNNGAPGSARVLKGSQKVPRQLERLRKDPNRFPKGSKRT